MRLVGAIILSIIGLVFLKMGRTALKDSANHTSYGVESAPLHRKFSYVLIGLGIASSAFAGWLWASLFMTM